MSGHRVLQDLANAPNEVLDPGTGEKITVDRSFQYVPIESGGSGETNELPDPLRAGIVLLLHMITHGGGDRVVTADTAFDQTGNNQLTFGAADDFIALVSVRKAGTSGYRWQILENDGVALADNTTTTTTAAPTTTTS